MVTLNQFATDLSLDILNEGQTHRFVFTRSDSNRPGLQLAGYYGYFVAERPQILGKMEISYLETLSAQTQYEALKRLMRHPIPCVILCRSMECPPSLLEAARETGMPLLRTTMPTSQFIQRLGMYLNNITAPDITRHGVLVDVYSTGVLLLGQSGIGKSECALELIKRGHRLVADDVVEIRRVNEGRIVGQAPQALRYLMEIRGVGILDIQGMFGISSVVPVKSVDLCMKLEAWQEGKVYDRLGMFDQTLDFLGVSLPLLTIPVRPGRNLAIIVEVAARNLRMRQEMGMHSGKALMEERLPSLAKDSNNPKA